MDQGARYQLRGYFSALNEGKSVTLVYVWDVLDTSGSRVHRIAGQETGGSSSTDPWNGVSSAMMQQVARNTMQSLRSWLERRSAG